MVMPSAELVLGISTCDTSPSSTGNRVMPEKEKKKEIQICPLKMVHS
jgi:hypothetical protein